MRRIISSVVLLAALGACGAGATSAASPPVTVNTAVPTTTSTSTTLPPETTTSTTAAPAATTTVAPAPTAPPTTIAPTTTTIAPRAVAVPTTTIPPPLTCTIVGEDYPRTRTAEDYVITTSQPSIPIEISGKNLRTGSGPGWSRQTGGDGTFVLHYGFDQPSGTPIRLSVWMSGHSRSSEPDCVLTVQIA